MRGSRHVRWARRVAASAALALLTLPFAAQAQPILASKVELIEGNRDLAKVAGSLLQARRLAAGGAPDAKIDAAVPMAAVRDRSAVIEIRLYSLTPELLGRIEALGMEVAHASFRYARIDGRLELGLLDEVAALPEVATIHPNYGYVVSTGSVDNQADMSIRALDARMAFPGVDGSGVDVGIISDSFNNGLGGSESGGSCTCNSPGDTCANNVTGMANQVSGDLPASIPLLDDGPGGLSDEGAAIGELIADLAPASGFLFHSAATSLSSFAEGITQLANCGADVVIDDVIYFAEPMFQDGIIANAAQAAVDDDIPYFSAAGNQATFGVDDFYFDSDPGTDDINLGDDLHDFAPGSGASPSPSTALWASAPASDPALSTTSI
jgi:hypothetical protein